MPKVEHNTLNKDEMSILTSLSEIASKNIEDLIVVLLDHKKANQYPYKLFDENFRLINNKVSLSILEKELAVCLGVARNQRARKEGKINMIQDSKNEMFNEWNGIGAELAYGKMFNLYPYETLHACPRDARDDYGDYYHNGKIVDVKTTQYNGGRLILGKWKHDHIDWFCLMIGDINKDMPYSFRGYFSSKELMQSHRYKPLPGQLKPVYQAEQWELNKDVGLLV